MRRCFRPASGRFHHADPRETIDANPVAFDTPGQDAVLGACRLRRYHLLINWGLIGVYIFFPDPAAAKFGAISGSRPLFFLATWSPATSAFVIVCFYAGTPGIRAFLSRLLLGRCSAGWAAFILIGLPLVFVVGSLLKGGPMLAPLPPKGIGFVVAVLFMMLFLGPMEEFGWRGEAQPLLQRHMAPIRSGAFPGCRPLTRDPISCCSCICPLLFGKEP